VRRITARNSENPSTIEIQIEQLCAEVRALSALALELQEALECVRKLMAIALRLSRQSAEMKRNLRKLNRKHLTQRSHLRN
jgi:hypothetical protein